MNFITSPQQLYKEKDIIVFDRVIRARQRTARRQDWIYVYSIHFLTN